MTSAHGMFFSRGTHFVRDEIFIGRLFVVVVGRQTTRSKYFCLLFIVTTLLQVGRRQCDQIGLFLNILEDRFLSKVAQVFGDSLAILQNYRGYFLGIMLKNLGQVLNIPKSGHTGRVQCFDRLMGIGMNNVYFEQFTVVRVTFKNLSYELKCLSVCLMAGPGTLVQAMFMYSLNQVSFVDIAPLFFYFPRRDKVKRKKEILWSLISRQRLH